MRDYVNICLNFNYHYYLNWLWKKRHIRRELFNGYLIMYFSKKKNIYFCVYRQLKVACCFFIQNCKNLFFVKPSFWKSKNTNRLHFWWGLRIYISFWLNRKKEVMTKRRQIAIKLIGSYMRIYMYFIEQWGFSYANTSHLK